MKLTPPLCHIWRPFSVEGPMLVNDYTAQLQRILTRREGGGVMLYPSFPLPMLPVVCARNSPRWLPADGLV